MTSHADSADPATLDLLALASKAAARGWTAATSGNFSVRLSESRGLCTATGRDKSELTARDLVILDFDAPLTPSASAEAPIHAAIYRSSPEARAVVHVHSVAATVVSRRWQGAARVSFEGLEMQKAIRGHGTHDGPLHIVIYPNTQDMVQLGETVARDFAKLQPSWAFLLSGHGLYAWGASAAEAWRHAEAIDFLLTVRMHEGTP